MDERKQDGNERIEQIVFYHGSLEELNDRGDLGQFEYVKGLDSYLSARGSNFDELAQSVRRSGYDGLVNYSVAFYPEDVILDIAKVTRVAQGTPIRRRT